MKTLVLKVRFFKGDKGCFTGFSVLEQNEVTRGGRITGYYSPIEVSTSECASISMRHISLRGRNLLKDRNCHIYFYTEGQVGKLFSSSVLALFDFVLNNRTKLKRSGKC